MMKAGLTQSRRGTKGEIGHDPAVLRGFVPPCESRISGTTDWQGRSYTITGSGTHTLRTLMKSEARSTKSEANSKHEWPMSETQPPGGGPVWDFVFWSLRFVSNFEIRISDLTPRYDSAGRRIEKAYDGQTVCKYL
jgi:hypothetical protein